MTTNKNTRDILFRDAARATLCEALNKMMSNAEGTRKGKDIEALHDMRVGSRRLRAALSLFGKIFPPDEFRALDKEVGAITDALGAVRDLDVQLDYFSKMSRSLPPNEAYGIERLMARRRALRKEERKALLRALDKLEKSRFARRFEKALERAAPSASAKKRAA